MKMSFTGIAEYEVKLCFFSKLFFLHAHYMYLHILGTFVPNIGHQIKS